jgi:hypothetical protein
MFPAISIHCTCAKFVCAKMGLPRCNHDHAQYVCADIGRIAPKRPNFCINYRHISKTTLIFWCWPKKYDADMFVCSLLRYSACMCCLWVLMINAFVCARQCVYVSECVFSNK